MIRDIFKSFLTKAGEQYIVAQKLYVLEHLSLGQINLSEYKLVNSLNILKRNIKSSKGKKLSMQFMQNVDRELDLDQFPRSLSQSETLKRIITIKTVHCSTAHRKKKSRLSILHYITIRPLVSMAKVIKTMQIEL